MNEKGKISVKLIVILLFVIIAAVTVAIMALQINKKEKQPKKNNEVKQQTVNPNEEPNEKQEEVPNKDIDTSKDFELSFLKMEQNKENIIYSPLSIKYALNMLNEGANENTKKQINKIIKDLDTTTYGNIDKVLSLANGIYIRDTYSDYIKEEYIDILEDKYNAEVKYDSFKNAKNINKWIEDKTLGQIKNLLKDEQVANPDNKMALINALAIDMEWENRFDAKDTHGVDFYLEDGKTIKATTMNQEIKGEGASYYKGEDVTALAMDLKEYDDTQLEFLVIMPEDNLSKYIENVTLEDIENIVNDLKPASKTKAGIDISIPRFSYDYSIKLKEELKILGITDAFDPEKADFSGMTDRKRILCRNCYSQSKYRFYRKRS